MYKDEEEEETGGGGPDPTAEGDTTSAVLADDEMSLDSVEPAVKSPEHAPATAQASLDSERSKDTGRRTHTFSVKSRRTSTKYTHSRRQSESSVKIISQTGSDPLLKSKSLEVRQSSRSYESDEESMYSTRPEWAFDQIAMLSDESDSEFFDAKGVWVGVGVCGCGWVCGGCEWVSASVVISPAHTPTETISDDEISEEDRETETESVESPRISTTQGESVCTCMGMYVHVKVTEFRLIVTLI